MTDPEEQRRLSELEFSKHKLLPRRLRGVTDIPKASTKIGLPVANPHGDEC